MAFQGVELAVPIPGPRREELLRDLHRGGAKPVSHPAPLTWFGCHQPSLGQQSQMFRDALTGDG